MENYINNRILNSLSNFHSNNVPVPNSIAELRINNPPKLPATFAIVSPCFGDFNKVFNRINKREFENNNIPYITYGDGEVFTNKVYTHLLRLYDMLEEIEHQYTIVLIMDSKDVFYTGSLRVLEVLFDYFSKYNQKHTIVFASQKDCHPSGSDIFYCGDTPNLFLNSGLIIGGTKFIKFIIKEMIKTYDLIRFEAITKEDASGLTNSQTYWHRYYNEGKFKNNLIMDKNNRYFYCMSSCNPFEKLTILDPITIGVNETMTIPSLLHFNGCFNEEYVNEFLRFYRNSIYPYSRQL